MKSIPNLSHQITLTKAELKKLNIEFDGKLLVYKNRFAINHQKMKLEIRNGGTVPSVYIDKHYRFFKTHKPQVFPYCTSDTLLNTANFYFKIDEDKSVPYVQLRDQFLTMIDSVVPVRIKYNSGYTQLFWFPKNEAFIKKLSKENQEKIIQTNDDLTLSNNRKINIASLKLLQLNNDELSGLGIQVSYNGVSVPTMIDKGKSYYTTYSKEGTMIGKVNVIIKTNEGDYKNKSKQLQIEQFFIHADDTSNTINGSFVEPNLITDDMGNYWRSYKVNMTLTEEDFKYLSKNHLSPSGIKLYQQEDSIAEQKIMSRISTMVPVLVRTGDTYSNDDKLNKRWRPDVILWYEPTDSFFAALPKNIADEIKSEYTAIKANQPTPSCKYFEVCRSVKGMINEYSVFPNPTNNELNVLIDLAEERKLTISLTDISGKIVKNYSKDLVQSKGKKEYPFQIDDVSEGMYLLLIETDKGERVTQRIIKK